MSTFSNQYITWVGVVCIVPWETFDTDMAFYLINGEL